MLKTHILLGIGFLILFPTFALSRGIEGVGTYSYGPSVSEAAACHLATQKARKEALNMGASEVISGQEMLLCKETGNTEKCMLNKSTWSEVTGLIRNVKIISKKIINPNKDFKTCRIKISADVKEFGGQRDPGFDFSASLNRDDHKYRDQEKIEFLFSPTTKMYLTIFLWDPHDDNEKQVSRIFPNALDRKNLFVNQSKVPTTAATGHYQFRTVFSKNAHSTVIHIDQYVLVVATRSQISFKERYTLEELNGRLLEIPAKNWRRKRIDFYVLSGKK
jgi:hypothetical protein